MSGKIARIEILENRCLLSAVVGIGGITGLVFDDHNGSGTQDKGDQTLAGVRVFIDLHDTGVYAKSDPYVLTNSKGIYAFANLTPGAYAVSTLPPAGFQQNFPFSGPDQWVAVSAGKTASGINFAETTGSHVSGAVYSNATGKLVGLPGVTVTITAANGKSVVYTRTTDSVGYYGIGGLPNTSYKVTLQLPAAYMLASGSLSQITPALKSGQNDNALNFTLTPIVVYDSSDRFVDVQAGTSSQEQQATGTNPFNGSVSGEDDTNLGAGQFVDLSGLSNQTSTLTPTGLTDHASEGPDSVPAVSAVEEDDLPDGANASAQAESSFQATFTVKAAISYSLNVAGLEAGGPYQATFSFTGPGGVVIAPASTVNGGQQTGILKPGTYTITYDFVCYDNDDNAPEIRSYSLDLEFGG